jgi:predicted nucleic acid-binding protein
VAETRVIVDTGPIVAFLVKEETHHQWVIEQFQNLPAPFLTCESVLTGRAFNHPNAILIAVNGY